MGMTCRRKAGAPLTGGLMSAVPAVIYSRISHDPEGRQAGVERQEQDCRQMAAERGWSVVDPIYRENDTGASTRSNRRAVFEQMLHDVEDGSIGVLLAYSTSRLTRRPLEYERLIYLTARTGLQIHTVVAGPVQLHTADGRAIARVLAVIDAAEAERTAERVSRRSCSVPSRACGTAGHTPRTATATSAAPPAVGWSLRLMRMPRRSCGKPAGGWSKVTAWPASPRTGTPEVFGPPQAFPGGLRASARCSCAPPQTG